jgi:hypothetical protein
MGIKSKSNKLSFSKLNYTKDSLILIHQNIRGLGGKIDELMCSIVSDNINPHRTRKKCCQCLISLC